MSELAQATTAAHTVHETVTIEYQYPEHAPRETDVHYHLFHEAVARIRRLGKWQCWISNADCDLTHPLEAHHSLCEFSLAPDVDVERFAKLYPEFGVTDDETFLAFVEGEGNLTVLCRRHHRQYLGVHVLPYPVWLTQRFIKAGVSAPAREVISIGPGHGAVDAR